MPYSLFLFLHSKYQESLQKKFDQHSKVLTQTDIEELLKHPQKDYVLRILRSAVAEHNQVEGVPYYLNYPVAPLYYHDQFKRTAITVWLTPKSLALGSQAYEDAVCVLKALCETRVNAGYVQILAWRALGAFAQENPALFAEAEDLLHKAMADTAASFIGVLVFCDQFICCGQRKNVKKFFENGRTLINYRVQKVLYYYALSRLCVNESDLGISKAEPGIKRFLNNLKHDTVFSQNDLNEGLTLVGLFTQNQQPHLWENTLHAGICRQLIKAADKYLRLAGHYVNSTQITKSARC